ncbi:fatty acid synthetase alpha subunit [Coprinopsis cinerea okayama7|uniref:Fatty acid synthase subunit alpha n=1 Tax=Coprinopsis cinerea (strain Okayama-7 / 130 / ATCC MYA-4618 / FGSC 9003) TaxID=240176 RepID=A8NUB3_COPC7|nr:fatty acid synthetase alpha subunit [Coprinopsis cinerea okayama7\|eukprot:XP_001836417.1 fatty acid synthetase alpha subunit [Coprinopsis cinerea okayama7\
MASQNGHAIHAKSNIATRPLVLNQGTLRISIPVSTSSDEWIAAEVLRDEFATAIEQDPIVVGDEDATSDEAKVEFAVRFLALVADSVDKEAQSIAARTALLLNVLKYFTSTYLSTTDIHTLTASFTTDTRKAVLAAYFAAVAALQNQGVSDIPRQPQSALLEAASTGKASIYALFGGQGTNEVYLNELQELYDIYKPFIHSYLQTITDEVLVPLAEDEEDSPFFTHGLDVLAWLSGAIPRPSVAYTASVPISFPLIGLTQLVQYLVVCHVAGLTPGQLRDRIGGATGHSQGIVSAVAISASSTFEEFTENSIKALKWLFYSGLRGQQAFPVTAIEPSIVQDAIEGGEGTPSPMLSVTGLGLKDLQPHIEQTNKHLPDNSKLFVSLHNGPKAFIITGPPKSLFGLVTSLRKIKAPSGADQSKIPFSQRKPVFSTRFLVVGVPYHSDYLTGLTDKVISEDLEDEELWKADDLKIPVYNTEDGTDLRGSAASITRSLFEQIFTLPIHWTKATNFPETATHVIDFGPGGASGIGPLTAKNFEGRGIRVIVAGVKGKGDVELFNASGVKYEDWWSKKWSPRLVKNSEGELFLDTPFSRLLGKPPIMVAGMTPSTVKAGFVSAVLDAGYHIELAGGGHYNAKALRSKVAEIQEKIPAGVGLTLNALYINPRQFTFQFPLWQEMRKEGLPIEGFCVAAGIPTTEKAVEIIDGLKNAGIKHVSFKPGSVDGIRQVINIAAANPDFPIIMQWTGGRAGGHHSFEDFHQPVLSTYRAIREHPNIILVGGSGFGSAEDVWEYLTGDWSVTRFGVQPMPFDGFLFASRVMVAKEAHTSSSVKDLIVAASGVDDSQWEGTYTKPTGGILTVRSELGEPIHKVATRGVKLWKEFDDTVFKLPKEKRVAWLKERRDEVIEKLNRDFAKPWFGWKKDGSVAKDLSDMTYEETVLRMVALMYVKHQKRWIDISLRNLTGDWLRRVEERFASADGFATKPSLLQSYTSLDDPLPFVEEFFKKYPLAAEQLLAAEDTAYFLAISQRPGQKPAPFIPVLDASFEVWFKKDSLWAAEDIDAVFDQDPQRVCILQGPVAVKWSVKKDEPVKEILGNVNSSLIQRLLERSYNGDVSSVPVVDYIAAAPKQPAPLTGITRTATKDTITYEFGKVTPDTEAWLETLAGPDLNWLRALVTSKTIVRGSAYVDNNLRALLTPRPGQKVVVTYADSTPVSVATYGAARSYGSHIPSFKAVEIKYDPTVRVIDVTLFEERKGSSVPLLLKFQYKPSQGFNPIHEIAEDRNTRIKEFYWKLWYGDDQQLPAIDIQETFTGPEVVIKQEDVEQFCSVVGNQNEAYKGARSASVRAPMDFAIVTGWQAIMKSIFPSAIDGDLLRLVHLSNGFRMVDGAKPLRVGDVCNAEARIVSVVNSNEGKIVKVKGYVLSKGQRVIEVVSSFLYRGRFTDFENTFETTEEPEYLVPLESDAAVGVLQSKEWFEWDNEHSPLTAGTSLVFRVQSHVTFKDKATYRNIAVTGNVYVRNQLKVLVKVGSVDFHQDDCLGNPVTAYLQRHGTPQGLTAPLPNDGYTLNTPDVSTVFTAPLTNEPYSKVSGDFNPIHINPYFSDFASLPATITHGMWSSAATRRFVETVVAQGHPERVIAYDVSFVGMVNPGDELSVKLRHVGMRDGNIVVNIETVNSQGEKVLLGSAEVAQPTTVYVFTGQGSQEPGMGMDLYNSSPAARAVWEGADAHLRAVYGFSIVEIVKDNPKEKTIHFGGIKGQAIRQRYMEMTYDTMDKDGQVKTLPLFGDINIRTAKYTFSHPNGLLFATQFAQIALVVTEKAAFEDMRAKGFVQKDCAFAGHSLGEYSALASIADVLHISALVDVVFYRGITMQRAVERDSQNRSNYAMCAVNPSRISPSFTDAALREVVESIATITDTLLEIVNFNVEGQQYVCAGELVSLQTLTNVLNFLKVKKIDFVKLTETFTVDKVKEMLSDIVKECYQRALEQQKAQGGYIKLERGFATIPLPGIDVPFHSRYLWAGVLPFRAYLSKKINAADLNPDMLVGKYIPNLIARPFEVSQEYAQIIYDQTTSPRLDKVLKKWDQEKWGSPENRQKLAYIILVELLAYQFASPVRWIETQDRLFTEYKFERFIEIGPSPTLTGMATRTLKAKYETADGSVSHTRSIFCHSKNQKEIYYQFEDEPEAPPAEEAAPEPSPVAAPAAAAAPVPAAAPAPASAGPVASVEDEPIKAIEILTVIVAQKLKKKVDEVPLSKSIKDLVGGKSTLQNEILGDLQQEFSSAPEKGEELPLEELGSALGTGFSGSLGKYSTGLISRLVGGKMPGGFNASAIKSYLNKAWGLGPSRSDGVLLLATTLEPPKRLASEAEAKAWLDSVVPVYAQRAGISLSAQSSGGAAGGGGGGAVINSEEFIKFQAEQEKFALQQIEVYMRYLGRDSRAGELAFDAEKANATALQAKLDSITREHGDFYIDGIQPRFDPLKARHFDSSWNWARQDALIMFYDIIHGRLRTVDREITARCIALLNRADADMLKYMQYYIDRVDPSKGPTYKLAKEFGQQLIDNVKEVLGKPPMYKDVTFPTAPHTEVTAKGDIVYSEVVRENVRKLEAYVEEMATADNVPGTVNINKVQDDVQKLWTLVKDLPEITDDQKHRIKDLYEGVVRSLNTESHSHSAPSPAPRSRRSSSQFLRPQVTGVRPVTTLDSDKVPLLHLKRRVGNAWEYSNNLTGVYLDILHEIATSGTTFKDKNALLTGVGKGSIGIEIVKGLLAGGAHVVITTSSYSRKTVEYYQAIYHSVGSRGSALTVVPFNQASKQDVEALVDYIYSTLGLDLDYILPFAGIPENGREIDGLDDRSELAHRMMLVNLLRILGAVKNKKASRQFVTRPTQVILPLSPNHGLFGNDGLYSESKISLETLFQRWASESWGEYLCLAGAVIGWTRGTGLMGPTNIVAHELEGYGVRTFSAKEMAFNILGLMHPLLFSITQVEPIWADLNGGMDRLPDLAEITGRIRNKLNQKADLRRAIARDNSADFKIIQGVEAERLLKSVDVLPRANFRFEFPELGGVDSFKDVAQLRGLIDLEKVVVITGYGEVSPWGSARTRWEMEARGELTIEACIEMAWIMGFIKHFNGRLKDGSLYVGWVDTKTNEPIDDKDVKGRYEAEIIAHAGVRLIEPELFRGYDPNKKVFNQEIELIHDLEPIEVSETEAQKFKLQHGDKCDIWAGEGGQWFAKFKKGACVLVPKAFKFSRTVAGQIPTGWHAGRYGIPDDIIAQTDRATLWALVCTAEALNASGITDPYELYKHMHPSEVGTAIGSGMGGVTSMAKMFKDRRDEKEVQNDILQETFINTTAGWINLLLLSSSGPVKIPVGACATALQSLEIASDTILSGKAKVMLAGGFDDISEEGSYEFANMKATSNAETEFAMGREPTEMSRPATTSRAGFMESQGCGVHVVMSAKTALELGAPIRGILAFTSTSTDKAGRSVPAPGKGALTVAREVAPKFPPVILDPAYRARQLAFRRKQISQWLEYEQSQLQEEVAYRKQKGEEVNQEYIDTRLAGLEEDAARQEKGALAMYGMLEGYDPEIAPLRRALAVWGLTADDIGILSIHGTSTKANEENETRIWNDVFTTISRTPGNAVPVVAQKSLLGHAKGGAAAWQMGGLLQSLLTGIVPGNRNSDNIDSQFQDRQFLMFPSKPIHTDGIHVGVMSSFGFGQVGGTAMVVHPRYLLGALEPSYYEAYKSRNRARALQSYKVMSEMMINNSLVKVKDHPPYIGDMESKVLLNSMARAEFDTKTGEFSFKRVTNEVPRDTANVKTLSSLVSNNVWSQSPAGVGVDQELISAVPSSNPNFVSRNFTDEEIAYCQAQPSPPSSFAARWVGKEAVFKSLGVRSQGAAAAMKDIEIVNDSTGAPTVRLHGEARRLAEAKGIKKILISLSHSDTTAVAFAQASSA